MRIVHVITGLSRASGVTTFVENVMREERALGHEVTAVTNGTENPFAFSERPDFIHIHGLWSPLLHRASRAAARRGVPVLWSTHGMTAPWSLRHKWWKKMLPWFLYQRHDLRSAACIHCTTELEAEWNRALGFRRLCIAPLGAVIPPRIPPFADSAVKTLLFVGRIYPVKALDVLIRAFALAVGETRAPWKLRIVGPDQAGHQAELTRMPECASCRVEFAGPAFGAELEDEYANCAALALVSHTENFGATVVDALARGRPVVTSTKTPWKVVSERSCGWWVDNDVPTLARALAEMFALSDAELSRRGMNGRILAEERYGWPAVTRQLLANAALTRRG